ncbi:MAG: hypothetical protein ACPGJR_12205 [Akkermansiaceae bacterium]
MRTKGWIALVAALITANSPAQKWPIEITPPPNINAYRKSGNESLLYRTRHFEIKTFKDHQDRVLKTFVKCAESVPEVIQRLPIRLYAPPERSPFQIQIHPDKDSYQSAGGAKGTAGFYESRKQTVLLQWDFLFDRNTPAGQIPKPNFDLVIHELTHLSMHSLIPRIEVWLSEGIAEYLVSAHVGDGRYRFDKIDTAIAKRIRSRHPKSTGTFTLPPLSELLNASFRDWLASSKGKSGDDVLEPYDASLLLVHYCFHGGEERRKQTREYFQHVHQNKPGRLLPVKGAPAIEKVLAAYWKKRGLKLLFRKP